MNNPCFKRHVAPQAGEPKSIGEIGSEIVFFCFKQKTAYEMSIGDWSSDVCSSDLKRIADAYAKVGWIPTVVKGGLTAKYSAPSAGPPPWHVYEVRPETIFALGTSEPYGATRWNFQTETDGK